VVDDGRSARVRGGMRLRLDKVERMHLRMSLHQWHNNHIGVDRGLSELPICNRHCQHLFCYFLQTASNKMLDDDPWSRLLARLLATVVCQHKHLNGHFDCGFLVLSQHTPSPGARRHTPADDADSHPEGPVLSSQLTRHRALDGLAGRRSFGDPRWVIGGSPIFGRHPWVPAEN
jgi:hypothetical protein